MVNTSNATGSAVGFPFDLKPDYSVYSKPEGGGEEVEGFDFSRVDFVIGFESGSDPFVDDHSGGRELNTYGELLNPFVCPSDSEHTRQVLGRLTAYATALLNVQYRTHMFMVFIVKDYARLIRWDRSCALVTAKIPINEESHLLDFLIRYNIASPEARGHDRTVGPPTQDEVKSAKAVVPELKSLVAVGHLGNRYIICPPMSRPRIPVGRWTRPSIAFDIRNKRRVFLKDSWRVLLEDGKPEGVIYRADEALMHHPNRVGLGSNG